MGLTWNWKRSTVLEYARRYSLLLPEGAHFVTSGRKAVLSPTTNHPAIMKSMSPMESEALSAMLRYSVLAAVNPAALSTLPATAGTVLLSTSVLPFPEESARLRLDASSIFQ